MTKAINRLAESFHRAPPPSHYALHHPFAFAQLRLTSPRRCLFHFHSAAESTHYFPPSILCFSRCNCVVFSSLRFSREKLLLPVFLFLSPRLWRILTNNPSSLMPSRSIDRGFDWQTRPALSMSARCFLAIDHFHRPSRSLTRNNVYMMVRHERCSKRLSVS